MPKSEPIQRVPCAVVEDVLPRVLSGEASKQTAALVEAHIKGSEAGGIAPCKACALVRDVIADELESAGRDRHRGAAPYELMLLSKANRQLRTLQWAMLAVLLFLAGAMHGTATGRLVYPILPALGALGFLFTHTVYAAPIAALLVPLLAALRDAVLGQQVTLGWREFAVAVGCTALGSLVALLFSIAVGDSSLFRSRYLRVRHTAMRVLAGVLGLALLAAGIWGFIRFT